MDFMHRSRSRHSSAGTHERVERHRWGKPKYAKVGPTRGSHLNEVIFSENYQLMSDKGPVMVIDVDSAFPRDSSSDDNDT